MLDIKSIFIIRGGLSKLYEETGETSFKKKLLIRHSLFFFSGKSDGQREKKEKAYSTA